VSGQPRRERRHFIVKVQRALAGNRGDRVLIYDEERSIQWEGDCTSDIAKLLDGAAKMFVHATVERGGKLMLGERAPWQDW
jgi:hypothetical protein